MNRITIIRWSFLACMVSVIWAGLLTPVDCLGAATEPALFEKLCQEVQGQFTPITQKDLVASLQKVREAARELDRFFATAGAEDAQAWRESLDWSACSNEFSLTAPDLKRLETIYSKLGRDEDWLALARPVALRSALGDYLNLSRAVDNRSIEKAYKNLLGTLPKLVADYRNNPTPPKASKLDASLAWLVRFNQAQPVVEAIRGEFCYPNFLAQISRDFAALGLEETIEEDVTVCDRILRTPITGSGTMNSATSLAFIPSKERAILQWQVDATAVTENMGRRGNVRIYSEAITEVVSTKNLFLDSNGLTTEQADSTATTSTHFKSICAGQLIRKFAWQKACQSKRQAESIAASHARCRANRRINDQAAREIARFNEPFINEFKKRLTSYNAFPSELNFSTTDSALNVVASELGLAQLAASDEAPKPATSHDLNLQLHQSAINNLASTMLSGRTVDEERLFKLVEELLGRVPDFLKREEDQPTWEIQFAKRDPLTVSFAKNGLQLVLRASRFKRDGSSYPGMDVSVAYRIEKGASGYRLIRDEKIGAYPPGFDSAKRRLSAREQTLRNLLQKRFAKIFPETQELNKPITLKERWEKAGSIDLTDLSSAGGWIVIGLDAEKLHQN
jgi:hypothetical protein